MFSQAIIKWYYLRLHGVVDQFSIIFLYRAWTGDIDIGMVIIGNSLALFSFNIKNLLNDYVLENLGNVPNNLLIKRKDNHKKVKAGLNQWILFLFLLFIYNLSGTISCDQ